MKYGFDGVLAAGRGCPTNGKLRREAEQALEQQRRALEGAGRGTTAPTTAGVAAVAGLP